jgi:hypothetical protein
MRKRFSTVEKRIVILEKRNVKAAESFVTIKKVFASIE